MADEKLPLLRHADTRRCRECRKVKPIESFRKRTYPKSGKTYRIGTCRECILVERKWWWRNKATPEQKTAKRKRNREAYAAKKLEAQANV